MLTTYPEVVMSRLTARSWTSESTRRPVWTTERRSSRSPQPGPAWPPPGGSVTSPPRGASTCLNPLSLPPWPRTSPLHSLSRACEWFSLSVGITLFRHELLAGVGSEQVLCLFFANHTINIISFPNSSNSYNFIFKNRNSICRNCLDFHLQQKTLALHTYDWAILFALLCFAWSIIIWKIAFPPFMCLKATHYILKGLVNIQAAHLTIPLLGETIKASHCNLLPVKNKSRNLMARREEHVRNKVFFFKVLFCINGKKDSIKLLTFGTWIIISEYKSIQ